VEYFISCFDGTIDEVDDVVHSAGSVIICVVCTGIPQLICMLSECWAGGTYARGAWT
jgi:hypothetical protein